MATQQCPHEGIAGLIVAQTLFILGHAKGPIKNRTVIQQVLSMATLHSLYDFFQLFTFFQTILNEQSRT